MALAGFRPLLAASLRHELRGFAPWVAIATGLSSSSVLVYPWVFPTAQDRAELATALSANPALGIVFGPAFDLSTSEGFNSWRSLALAGFLTAIGAVFAVTRATRGQEDSGQAELLASGVLSRAARLSAGVGVALIGSVLVGVVCGAVTGLCGGAWADSLLLAATFTASGWMFTGVAAITAQLGSDSRTASSLAVGVLGVLFVMRGFAYSMDAPSWTIWVNPLGWMTQTKPAAGNDWSPLLFAVAFTVVALGVAFTLHARRDFAQGVIKTRPGPARGRVRSAWRLALVLNRGPVVTWCIAFVLLGGVFGYFATSIQDLLSKDSAVSAILAAGATTPEALTSAFLVTILNLVGIIAAVPGIQIMVKVRTEESADRVEPVLAGAITRTRYYAANTVLALATSTGCVLIAGTVISSLAASADIGVGFGDTMWQSVATIFAVWTVTAVSVAVIGARPHVWIAAWLGVLVAFVLTLLGPTFKLWDWVLAISPFWHVPNVTDSDIDWSGPVWISLVTVLLLAIGFTGFRRRDLAAG